MIIQCEQCTTKFRLDDAKVTEKGVKVRCAKCRHVFTVRKEQPEAEPQPDFSSMLEQASPQDQTVSFGEAQEPAAVKAPPEEAPAFSDAPPEFDFGVIDSQSSEPTAPPSADTSSQDFSAISFESSPPDDISPPSQPVAEPATAGEIDFGDFDFSDAVESSPAPTPELSPAPPKAVDETSFDFGSDNLFGDAIGAPTVEEPKETISFDFQMDGFADSMGVADSAQKHTSAAAQPTDEPFSLGEIDFGDELTSVAVQQVNPDELKPAQELLFAPLAEAQEKPAPTPQETAAEGPAGPTADEMPPLPIPSRRLQSPLRTGLIATTSIAAVAALGYFGFSSFSGDSTKVEQETGKISVRGIEAIFVKNKAIGDLLVISGEAVNDYKKPRASLQVKGMVYGGGGQVLTSKNAYAGNPLSREQLADMPLDKIEAAMTNQFGDSLANLEVAPGKAVPFTIVIPKPPTEAREFGVQPGGSTVATGKQP